MLLSKAKNEAFKVDQKVSHFYFSDI